MKGVLSHIFFVFSFPDKQRVSRRFCHAIENAIGKKFANRIIAFYFCTRKPGGEKDRSSDCTAINAEEKIRNNERIKNFQS